MSSDGGVDPVDQLTAPGGGFEVVREDVAGVELSVYASRMGSMADIVRMADNRGDQVFVVQGDRRVSFAEHNRAARRVAHGLLALGLERGDRVAIISANDPDWVVSFWACAIAGLVAVPLNAWWKTDELAFALADSGTRVAICDRRRFELIRGLHEELADLERIFVFGADDPPGPADPFSDLLGPDDDDPGYPEVTVDEDDVAGIFYTSGTTGKPKGATVTHRQVVANLQNIMVIGIAGAMRAAQSGSGDAPPELSGVVPNASLLIVPLFHTTGCHATMVLNYAAGYKLVLMPVGRFDPDVAMRLIEEEQITAVGGVSTVMWRMLESPRFGEWDLSTVTRISYGGAPTSPDLVERLDEAFPNAKASLTNAYGLTETASVATVNSGADYHRKPTSVGRPVPTLEVRVVDDAGHDAPSGTAGEVWLRGPTISPHGYWNRPDANAEVYTGDRWFKTGDIGKLDDEGFLFIVDRAKDMIIRGGENVYCVEVEDVLHEHPDVLDAAVVGVPHKTLGEEVKAVVHLRPGTGATAEDLREHCARHLAAFKVPVQIELADQPLPRNPAGKILKAALRGGDTAFSPEASSDSTL